MQSSLLFTKIHNLLEKYLDNVPVKTLTENLMPDIKQNFLDIRADVDRIDNIHYIEASLYSEKMLLAGRTDVIGEFDGTLSVIDFKTSRKEKKEEHIQDYFQQATAYEKELGLNWEYHFLKSLHWQLHYSPCSRKDYQ